VQSCVTNSHDLRLLVRPRNKCHCHSWDNVVNAHLFHSRQWFNMHIPQLLTKFGERAFTYAGPTAWNNWNSLPHELRAAPTLNSFKHRLKTHLFTRAALCDSDVSVRPSVRPSVCLSHAGIAPSEEKAGS